MSSGLSPAGVVAKLTILADLVVAHGSFTAKLSTATIDLEGYAPAPRERCGGVVWERRLELHDRQYVQRRPARERDQNASEVEGTSDRLGHRRYPCRGVHRGTDRRSLPIVPTPQSLVEAISRCGCRTPPPDGSVSVADVKPLALNDAVAFCLNNPGGNTAAIFNFICGGRSCAIAIDGAKVLAILDQQIHRRKMKAALVRTFRHTRSTTSTVTTPSWRVFSVSLRTGSKGRLGYRRDRRQRRGRRQLLKQKSVCSRKTTQPHSSS